MSTASLLSDTLGRTLVRIRRVLYTHRGAVTQGGGPLELTFADGTAVVLDAGGDGESLAVVAGTWSDPFEEPLSEENRAFVEKSGKWAAFEVSARDPVRRAVGSQILQVEEVRNPSKKIVGARFQVGDIIIRVSVDSDELLVDVA